MDSGPLPVAATDVAEQFGGINMQASALSMLNKSTPERHPPVCAGEGFVNQTQFEPPAATTVAGGEVPAVGVVISCCWCLWKTKEHTAA